MNRSIYIFLFGILTLLSSCASPGITRVKDIAFNKEHNLKLDVYASRKITEPKKVLVFIHGGRWKTGKKSQYKFLGNRFAHKGIVAVVLDYRLSASASYAGMAMDVAKGLKWVKENIISYGGDDQNIFVSGHSAGGHLAALVSTDTRYFDSLGIKSPVKGTVLIDAFGLDMYKFLSNESFKKNPVYYSVFTKNPQTWKDGSPAYFLSQAMPPFLMFVGGRTYPVIADSNKEFLEAFKTYHPKTNLITVKKKKHIPMILQFYNSKNKAYSEIIDFMDAHK